MKKILATLFIPIVIFSNYENIIKYIDMLSTNKIKKILIGRSQISKKPIYAYYIKGKSDKVAGIVFAGLHPSTEPSTAIVAINLINTLKYKHLKKSVIVVPVLNAGVKNSPNRRTNARWVDLNRNFPVGWKKGKFSGKRPLSESESVSAYNLILRHRPGIVIDLHQYGNEILVSNRAIVYWKESLPLARKLKQNLGWRIRNAHPTGMLIDTAAMFCKDGAVVLEIGGQKKTFGKQLQKIYINKVVAALTKLFT